MKIAVIAVTHSGAQLGIKVSDVLRRGGHHLHIFAPYPVTQEIDEVTPIEGPLTGAIGDLFEKYRGLVMIMALGIAIRTIAPHIRDKRKDPAVVVLDEGGSYVISALSGHVGGANDLAREIAGGIGARAVITTATDVRGAPAVDVIARDLKLEPDPPDMTKKVNGFLARGDKVYIYTEYTLPLEDSEYLSVRNLEDLEKTKGLPRVLVTGRTDIYPSQGDTFLRPRNILAGVGCKKGAQSRDIIAEIKNAFESTQRSILSLKAIATIREKAVEKGLMEAAAELGVSIISFEKNELNRAIELLGLEKSLFVTQKMGVGGVCEPAAMLACRKGRMLVSKRKGPGVTVALAEEESGWWE
ncbi:MAG: cobalt-precorrin 5A hydrolase [Bacillota bacterium]